MSWCALESDAEPLGGTAPALTKRWLLIEYAGPWARKGIESPDLVPVRSHLESILLAHPDLRLQLIRRPDSDGRPPRVIVADSRRGRMAMTQVERYEGLLDLSGAQLSDPKALPNASPIDEAYLVCTHGTRDRCCSRFGRPVFDAMAKVSDATWEASHLGGHRFAANVISLPFGYAFGRVSPLDAHTIIEAQQEGCVAPLGTLRGRTLYSAAGQVAEVTLRKELGEERIDHVRLLGEQALGDGTAVSFMVGERRHRVVVSTADLGSVRPKSCGDEPKPLTTLVACRARSEPPR